MRLHISTTTCHTVFIRF